MNGPERSSSERVPFPAIAASRAFMTSVTQLVREQVAERVEGVISQQNTLSFVHGGSFSTMPGAEPGHFQEFSYPVKFPLDAIRGSRATVLLDLTAELSENIAESQIKRLYEVVLDGAKSVGNAIPATPGRPIAEQFLEMAERVDYSVGEDGTVQVPSLHLHPTVANRIIPELHAQEAQYADRMEDIRIRKTAEALERERVRVSRFRME
jgi:hypothetical protein